MSEEIIVIPTGYLKVYADIDETAQELETMASLAYTRTLIEIVPSEGDGYNVPIRVGDARIIPLKPGLYRIRAIFGKLSSDYVNAEIKIGEVTTKAFHFGKERQ